MKKFKVDIIRTACQCLTVEIKADSPEQAFEMAHGMAGNLDFSGREKSCEYECEVMEEIES
jgi:hypothetical protein